jgi:hypothetical protein
MVSRPQGSRGGASLPPEPPRHGGDPTGGSNVLFLDPVTAYRTGL